MGHRLKERRENRRSQFGRKPTCLPAPWLHVTSRCVFNAGAARAYVKSASRKPRRLGGHFTRQGPSAAPRNVTLYSGQHALSNLLLQWASHVFTSSFFFLLPSLSFFEYKWQLTSLASELSRRSCGVGWNWFRKP